MSIRKILDVILIVGFIVVDWLILHDIFKADESLTATQQLTVFLSVLVFITAGPALRKK